MVTFAEDSFNRADAAVLGNADTGQPWNASNWGIASNTARKGGGGSNNVWLAAGIVGDHRTEIATILTSYAAGNQLFGPLTRYLNEDNFILWERVLVPGSEDAVKLYVRTNNVWNQRAIWGGGPGATGLNPNDPLALAVEQIGLELACLVNGVEVASYTLTSGENAALGSAAGIRNEGSLEAWFDTFSSASTSASVVGSASASLPITATVASRRGVRGTGGTTLLLTATATGRRGVRGLAAAALGLTAAVAGRRGVRGTATAVLPITATAVGPVVSVPTPPSRIVIEPAESRIVVEV